MFTVLNRNSRLLFIFIFNLRHQSLLVSFCLDIVLPSNKNIIITTTGFSFLLKLEKHYTNF